MSEFDSSKDNACRMVQIAEPNKELWSIMGAQRVREGSALRASRFVVEQRCAEGTLACNTMTSEILLLAAPSFADAMQDDETRTILARKRFVVPEGTDESAFADQARSVLMDLAAMKQGVTSYTIFTTTDCNARCFYCYEMGRPRRDMREDTAHDVAAFISSRCGGNKVKLNWFGGEPLHNARVIDIICNDLVERGVSYTSSMISNGYLVDEDVIRRAHDLWNLHRVQITLDGTEDAYNRIKAYVDAQGSPYRRVLHNIGLLLDAGIRVSIRLNVHGGNVDELSELVDELAMTFVDRAELSVYAALLRDAHGDYLGFDEDTDVFDQFAGLREKLVVLGLSKARVRTRASSNHCMADADTSFTILPDGRLGKCEHFTESELVGTIYDGVTDKAMVAAWKQPRLRSEFCDTCSFYAMCTDLAKCPYTTQSCNELQLRIRLYEFRQRMLGSYRKWLNDNGEENER